MYYYIVIPSCGTEFVEQTAAADMAKYLSYKTQKPHTVVQCLELETFVDGKSSDEEDPDSEGKHTLVSGGEGT